MVFEVLQRRIVEVLRRRIFEVRLLKNQASALAVLGQTDCEICLDVLHTRHNSVDWDVCIQLPQEVFGTEGLSRSLGDVCESQHQRA